ncbi:hypothetical protein EDB84DRAFT_1267445 [Lactarius hengduanensis]|nr:hypothetical protein EDB84DRAFT_1267445 [Lactarius hengduanensis]
MASSPSNASASTGVSPGCQIAELLQFSCQIQLSDRGHQQFHCFPIPRLFRLCQGEPAIEITRVASTDPSTGKVNITGDVVQQLPKAKKWKDVVRKQP